ncbi:DNA oxidative demethylase ALKBH2-like [Centruroides sculpturatus]|uniref:DNA oxidative demethylase ALKBH2-like n=1 Tax=Centruroides sculpturatus TaxID=218467 RepID=UPI000C6E5139|nr:DNA oxidative demethylase ALKBH2-like [Centruroides sculpturatus]
MLSVYTIEKKRKKSDDDSIFESLEINSLKWKKIENINLNLSYTILFTKKQADNIFGQLEKDIKYFSNDLLKVKVFGKWHEIPRKQVAYGDSGLTYSFSGTTIPALPWTDLISNLRQVIVSVTGISFNFVLVNRYKNGLDHIGEHQDNEKELEEKAPIASLSFGQVRDFVLKHKESRGKNVKCKIDPVKIELEHGSLLMMNYPTNLYWYHSLPIRKKCIHPRVNLTFRKFKVK